MRQARIKESGLSYYHCLSRVVDRRFIFQELEKEHFVAWMRKLEAFHGIRVVTYCVMSNHFHLLVEEPDQDDSKLLDAETILKRLGYLYDPLTVKSVTQELDRARKSNDPKWEEEILDRYRCRMGDISHFMKDLKQRFSRWYNSENGRKGTLWEDRYKSMLVEGDSKALMTMAAYIDLNPVRAGMVAKVEDYRWCGYASAVGGNRWAREGLGRVLSNSSKVSGTDFEARWNEAAPLYRLWLYHEGETKEIAEPGERARRAGFEQSEVEAETARDGKLSIHEVLRYRVRYLTDGLVFGSEAFVNRVFDRNRSKFGKRRETGARRMKEANWEGLCVIRDLQGELIA